MRLVPRVGTDWLRSRTDPYAEQGGLLPASVPALTISRTRIFAGGEIGQFWMLDKTMIDVSAYGRLVDIVSYNAPQFAIAPAAGIAISQPIQPPTKSRLGYETGAMASFKSRRSPACTRPTMLASAAVSNLRVVASESNSGGRPCSDPHPIIVKRRTPKGAIASAPVIVLMPRPSANASFGQTPSADQHAAAHACKHARMQPHLAASVADNDLVTVADPGCGRVIGMDHDLGRPCNARDVGVSLKVELRKLRAGRRRQPERMLVRRLLRSRPSDPAKSACHRPAPRATDCGTGTCCQSGLKRNFPSGQAKPVSVVRNLEIGLAVDPAVLLELGQRAPARIAAASSRSARAASSQIPDARRRARCASAQITS